MAVVLLRLFEGTFGELLLVLVIGLCGCTRAQQKSGGGAMENGKRDEREGCRMSLYVR